MNSCWCPSTFQLLHKLYNFWPVVGISRLYPTTYTIYPYTQFNNLNMEQWEKILFQPPFIGRIHDAVSLQGWSRLGMASHRLSKAQIIEVLSNTIWLSEKWIEHPNSDIFRMWFARMCLVNEMSMIQCKNMMFHQIQSYSSPKPSTIVRSPSNLFFRRKNVHHHVSARIKLLNSRDTRPGYDIHSLPWLSHGPNRNRWFTYSFGYLT